MTPVVSESESAGKVPHPDEQCWSLWHWLAALTLVFGLHVLLFHFLVQRNPPVRSPKKQPAALQLQGVAGEKLLLQDPTLFVLPHPHGFAAATWLKRPRISFAPFRWTEPPRFLPLPLEKLGATFLELAVTNQPAHREIAIMPAPITTVLPPNPPPAARSQTTLRVTGGIANRARRGPQPALPLAQQEGLTNTVIQVLVDARGQVISSVVLPPGSGSKQDDRAALNVARNLWFQKAPAGTPATPGWLIFDWAVAPTNNTSPARP